MTVNLPIGGGKKGSVIVVFDKKANVVAKRKFHELRKPYDVKEEMEKK